MAKDEEYYPSALTVAGSDSGGGAGIQADLRTFAAFGLYGCSAITAVTAQNPFKVTKVEIMPAALVTAQLEAVISRFRLRVVKTGMMGSAAVVEAVVSELATLQCPIVVDPVMVSTSGVRLLQEDAVSIMCDKLLPLAAWITPNVPEAEILTGRKINNIDEMIAAGQKCVARWGCSCVIKGGHLESKDELMTDIVIHDGKVLGLSSPVLAGSQATHGTGCTFSSALASSLAIGQTWKEALKSAKGFVFGSLVEEAELGPGLWAMYPPIESYLPEIILKRID